MSNICTCCAGFRRGIEFDRATFHEYIRAFLCKVGNKMVHVSTYWGESQGYHSPDLGGLKLPEAWRWIHVREFASLVACDRISGHHLPSSLYNFPHFDTASFSLFFFLSPLLPVPRFADFQQSLRKIRIIGDYNIPNVA